MFHVGHSFSDPLDQRRLAYECTALFSHYYFLNGLSKLRISVKPESSQLKSPTIHQRDTPVLALSMVTFNANSWNSHQTMAEFD
jgi:hypothetical protein